MAALLSFTAGAGKGVLGQGQSAPFPCLRKSTKGPFKGCVILGLLSHIPCGETRHTGRKTYSSEMESNELDHFEGYI